MAVATPICNFGEPAKPFDLPAVDGKRYDLEAIRGSKGTLIVFMCNHCPYVRSILDRLVDTAKQLQAKGVGVAAICANDAANYPDDSFDKMKALADQRGFTFPYLHDESQKVAEAYGAVCTPDFFGYNADLGLQYRGRLDASKTQLLDGVKNELLDAMTMVAETGEGPKEQTPSMGCSIKWKVAA
ncbi:MAG: thioredoxin family protein [Geminicoccaceae bacterium]